jgi:hypothetical protein
VTEPAPQSSAAPPAASADFRAVVNRAQWAVIQTGLITSGLALFGVYVLATRINDLHLMSLYSPAWLPTGPLLAGLICGSGYILASWWFGVHVGLRMIVTIVLLQFAMFLACHYADFETLDLVYRDTGEEVSFPTYFHYTTRRLALDWARPGSPAAVQPSNAIGYTVRFAEALCFAAGGLLSALTLAGRPRCPLCGGLVRRREIARVVESGNFRKRLEEHARITDLHAFDDELARHAAGETDAAARTATELVIDRCEVCGAGTIEEVRPGADEPASEPWRIPVAGDFARQLYERGTKAQSSPRRGPRGRPGFPVTSRP